MTPRAWLMAACLLCTAAHADRDRARQYFEEGAKSYNLGEYEKALGEFKRAYLEHPEPLLLYNLGQSWRQLGEKLKAVGFYRAYLRELPSAPNAAEVRLLLLRLDGEILQDQQSREAPPSGAVAPPPDPVPAPQPMPAAPWFRNTTGWAVTGSGVLVALLGAGLASGALAVNDQARGASSLGLQELLHTRAERLEISGWAFVGAGAAAALAGVVLLAMRHRPMQNKRVP